MTFLRNAYEQTWKRNENKPSNADLVILNLYF
jgi:hypothetical protein